jgi:NADPH oxidase 5
MTAPERHPDPQIQQLRAELEQLTASFHAVAGPSGRITLPAFQKALDLRSDFVANHLFRQFDLDGNGAIERDEFIAVIEQLLTGTPEHKLAFLFRVHDQDRDGSIERIELERLVHLGLAESAVALPEALVDEMIDAVFEASDRDGDGRISFEEFASVFGGYPELLQRVTQAGSVWRVLRPIPDARGRGRHQLSTLRRASNWIEEHGVELLFLVVYALVNLALFGFAVRRYHAAGANGFVMLARGCGACLNFNGALILVPMLRHFTSWLRGLRLGRLLPIDHSVSFHKLVGHVIFGFAAIHTLAHLGNYLATHGFTQGVAQLLSTKAGLTGLALMAVTWLMWTFALEPIRRAGHFQLFHFVHLLYWAFFALLLVHGPVYWIWAAAPLGGYIAERLLRVETRAKKVEVETAALASQVTKLSFTAPRGWTHRAGDYLFIKLPAIARAEWHPFTISSAPERVGRGGEELTLHVRSLGNWTRALHELARGRGEQARSQTTRPAPLLARIDGPYGSPSAHIFETKFAVVIGAGIGVTPFAAILDSILRRHRQGERSSALERVHFIWINRDQHAFEWFTELLAELERADVDQLLDIRIYMTGGREQLDSAALALAREVFYAKTRRDIVTGLAAHTQFGRPDWDALLTSILREHAPERVEVFMCGPGALTRELQPLCRKLGMGFRHEVF